MYISKSDLTLGCFNNFGKYRFFASNLKHPRLHVSCMPTFLARFALCQAYIEHGKFLPLEEELENEEKAIEKQKAEKSAARLRKENAAVLNAERRKRTRER